MSRLHLVPMGAMGLVLSFIVVPRALAFAEGPVQGGGAASSTYTVSQKTVNLSPIVVYGRHIPLPVALQMVKKALKRPWSSNPKDADKMVCHFEAMGGSHFQTMYCQTNRQYFKLQDQTQTAWLTSAAHAGAIVPVEVAGWFDQNIINPGALRKLLKKLPPADSSYTLRVTDHGKPVLEYVIKDGDLFNIRWIKSKQ